MRKLPAGIQTFEKIRKDGYIYVDKTQYLWNLVGSGQTYFLSRPRRFGKSVFVTMLESYFRGQKDLFKGLWIESREASRGEKAWLEYPVISFYLSGGEYQTEDGLEDILNGVLVRCAEQYGLEGQYRVIGATLSQRFKSTIERLYEKTGRQVVVLVDEYDKPLLTTMLTDTEQEERNRQLYKGFFSVLKDEDRYLKFVFFTGVTKFTKVSIFSDLNQLRDISMSDVYSGICGISEAELEENFAPEIEAMAEDQEMTREECRTELKKMYDGYRFSKKGVSVYNPYSLLNAFLDKDFGRYWYGTGTPDILIRKLKESGMSLARLTEGVEATEASLQDYRVENPDPIPLYYQTGYLTICGFRKDYRIYSLKFPNDEVKYGFLHSLVPEILGFREEENPLTLVYLMDDLRKGDIDSFIRRLISLFASIPYPAGKVPEYEHEWGGQIVLLLQLMGAHADCEVHSATGRADCVVKTSEFIYVFEFKVGGTAEEALRQIDEKGYANPYAADRRKLYKIGVAFSKEKRNISDWISAEEASVGQSSV